MKKNQTKKQYVKPILIGQERRVAAAHISGGCNT